MGRIRDELSQIVGKTISHVVVVKNPTAHFPKSQLVLVFQDGTSYEFWANEEDLSMGGGLDSYGVDQVVELARRNADSKIHVCPSD